MESTELVSALMHRNRELKNKNLALQRQIVILRENQAKCKLNRFQNGFYEQMDMETNAPQIS